MIVAANQILLDHLARQVLLGRMTFEEAVGICHDEEGLFLTLENMKESI